MSENKEVNIMDVISKHKKEIAIGAILLVAVIVCIVFLLLNNGDDSNNENGNTVDNIEVENVVITEEEIVNTYAKMDENGQIVFSEDGTQIMIKDGMVEECNKALENLQNLEVQIENYDLTIDDLGEDLECTPDQLEALMPFMA